MYNILYSTLVEGGGGMYEETFLRDIASQNFSKFEVEYTGAAVTVSDGDIGVVSSCHWTIVTLYNTFIVIYQYIISYYWIIFYIIISF